MTAPLRDARPIASRSEINPEKLALQPLCIAIEELFDRRQARCTQPDDGPPPVVGVDQALDEAMFLQYLHATERRRERHTRGGAQARDRDLGLVELGVVEIEQ